jgi:hypothetical protein
MLEALMIITFGISWPTNILKSYKARTAKGKSLLFLIFIFCGYWFGIASKISANAVNYVCVFYIINSMMVFVDILLYFRNRALDRQNP